MKTLTRFVLENIYSRTLGGVFPPYLLINGSNPVAQPNTSDLRLTDLTDEELTEAIKSNALGIPMTMPLQIKRTDEPDSAYWTIPVEPMVSIHGHNVIVKRDVSKGKTRGSIKERWTQGDYEINIEGLLMNLTASNKYPEADIRKLRGYCESASLSVLCPLFEIYSISRIVIDDFDFPFTSGPANQAYKIKAYSDDVYKLLLTGDDLIKSE